MAKVNNRKSDSWRPGMVANGTGMISKNQKRKEKRLSMNLNTLKSNPGATPSKKQMLDQLNNSAQLNQNIRVPAFGKKNENKLLSTSLPVKIGKKFAPPSPQKNVKLTGILSNSNTPKSKGGKVTISKKVEERFIDSEAEEGEEPVTNKAVKPYEKGSLKRKLQKRKMSMQNEDESEDSELSDDDDSPKDGMKFFDLVASEGEETDDSDDSSDSFPMADGDSDDLDEEEDVDEEQSDLSGEEDFSEVEAELGEEEEDLVEEEDVNSAEDSDIEESESDSEVEEAIRQRIMATSKRRESVAAVPLKKEKAESAPLAKKIAVKPEPATPQSKKANVKAETTKKELAEKPQQVTVDKKKQPKEKVQKADDTKKADGGAEKAQKADGETKKAPKGDADAKKVQKKADNDDVKKSPYAGFIRGLPKKITADVVKATLAKTIDSQKIVGIREVNKSFIVYLEDENSLEDLLNKKFVIDEKCKFTVYKARESSTSDKKNKFVAFLPRISTAITHEILRDALKKELGADEVDKILDKRLYKPLQTRNVLVHFTNLEALQKMVRKEVFKVGTSSIVVRSAFETGVSIPTFKVVFNGVPEKTSEDALKSAIESKIGKNTVTSVRYSLTKPAYAFVSVVNVEAKEKALKLGNKVTVNGTKLEVTEFIAKNPAKKRAAPSEQAKERKKNKRSKKRKLNDGEATDTPKPGKENKGAAAAQQNGNVNNKKQKNASTEAPDSGAKDAVAKKKKNKQKPSNGPNNAKQEPGSPSKASVSVKGAGQKTEKGAGQKTEPQSPAKKTDDGSSPSPSKQKKKKNKQKNNQQNQQSPKAVDPKKQALTMKIESKKKNKKKGPKQQE